MGLRATTAVWATSRLNRSHRAFLLLLAIADRAGDDGVAWPGHDELAERLGLSARHLRRCLRLAAAAGELEIGEAVDGRVVYRLNLADLAEVDVAKLARHGLELTAPFGATVPDTGVRDAATPRRTPRSAKPVAGVRPTRARSSSRTVSEPSASGGSTPVGATAQELVAFYVDETRRRGAEPLSRLSAHVGREAKQLLADGATSDEIRAGLEVLVSKSLHPSALASCVQERRMRKPHTRGGSDGRFAAYDAGL